MSDNSEIAEIVPDIYKKTEFDLMLKFVRLGMWKNVNLAKVCGVNIDTITAWKKRPEVAIAYREAVEKVIRKRYSITDPEILMKELGMEVDAQSSELVVKVIPILGGETAHALPSNNSHPQALIAKEANKGSSGGNVSE